MMKALILIATLIMIIGCVSSGHISEIRGLENSIDVPLQRPKI